MSNTFDKSSVLESFLEEVNSYLPEIETNLERLAQLPDDMDALEETYRRTHTIGGSASMMDFPGLAHVAHGMEDILGDILDNLSPLDPPTLAFLKRSLNRLHRLVAGIQSGIDENAVIAEDDADYTQYRMQVESAAREAEAGTTGKQPQVTPAVPVSQPVTPVLPPSAPDLPSLDEVLASFRAPMTPLGENISWPEEPAKETPRSSVPSQEIQAALTDEPEPTYTPQPSALEMLVANSSRPTIQDQPPVTPYLADVDVGERASAQALPAASPPETPPGKPVPAVANQQAGLVKGEDLPVTQLYGRMKQDAQVLAEQSTALRRTLTQLRLAASIIETQRGEFKGFLDGSKDALDRMEEWAGKAMGLNLRNSPEQVRRYLPLSVMWVANSKLKKVLDLLTQMMGGVEASDEQMHSGFDQLQDSIEACGEALEQLLAHTSLSFTQEEGWTPWEMQSTHDPNTLREKVTFERRGDLAALRTEIEAQVRDEVRWEYENRPSSVAARAEMERQIRQEIREEFEARRQLQESVLSSESHESLRDLEERLRGEIEIEVRQHILAQLTGEGDNPGNILAAQFQLAQSSSPSQSSAPAAMQNAPTIPTQPARPAAPAASVDFGEEAAEIFRLEAEEHLQTISMFVAALEKAPDDRESLQGIRRATHTLKGAAGMMGFRSIADLSHLFEDLLDSIMEGAIAISSSVVSIILDTAEALDSLINNKGTEAEREAMVQALRPRYAELLGEQSPLAQSVDEELEAEIVAHTIDTTSGEMVVQNVVEGQEQGIAAAMQMARSDLSVRVPLTKLDELVNLFGELLVNRSVLEERLQRLQRLVSDVGVSSNRLRDVGQRLESRFEAVTLPSGPNGTAIPGPGVQNGNVMKNVNGRSEPAHLADFDVLELDRYNEFHQLSRGLSEGISDMTTLSNEMDALIRDCESVFGREGRLNTTFQDRLMKARLVPLSTVVARLYRTARAVALKQRKEFDLVVEGQETEVDRTVIEEIAGPLLHLIRNAVNHAIDVPEVRERQGKAPVGQIKLSAAYEGNQVVITVRDDGRGIDPERVRNAAIARGLLRPDQMLADNDIIELIFRPGFSTAEVLSEESGRGVGLDVVRDSVSRLRGTLEVESTPGQGTAFTMKFPTSLAIQNTMMVMVGDQQFAIPTVMVESIGRMDTFKHSTFAGRPAVLVQNDFYPITLLSQLLGLPVTQPDEKAPMLLVRTDRHRVALLVDSIKGKLDVVMKGLGPHLRHVHGVAGGTVLGNGRVMLILEIAELLAGRPGASGVASNVSALASRRVGSASPAAPAPIGRSTAAPAGSPVSPARPAEVPVFGKHVLVVDDSPSVRRVVGNMLKQNGWEVQSARDGVEALEMISREAPAAVLLDIEMPRMDGYELMATVRAQEQYRTLPLVVLTSRAAAKHQQRAMQLGANAYVVKPYQDEDLLNTLKSLVYGATVR